MNVKELTLPQTNAFATAYVQNQQHALQFFDYHIEQASYEMRKEELYNRTFPRQQLVQALQSYNGKFNFEEKTIQNIQRLHDPQSTVVIGGQQAGLLTGPLYTIHKIISIIQLSKEQELKLNTPVIPVFWIAGEDHDFDEINHVFSYVNREINKKSVNEKNIHKEPMSNKALNKDEIWNWVKEIIGDVGEREHTRKLLHVLKDNLKHSNTYTDFFAHFISILFKDSGLVLVDSGDNNIREIEGVFFEKLIEENESYQSAIMKQTDKLIQQGFQPAVQVDSEQSNLFYLHQGERILLRRLEGNVFVGKQNEVKFSKEELIQIAKENPHLLSNNVLSRPLMQEMLFPCLSFIAGPGEIAYWAVLKEAFSLFDVKVPPVVPRHMITIVERQIEKRINEYHLHVEEVMLNGTEHEKEKWLNRQKQINQSETFRAVNQEMKAAHQKLIALSKQISSGLVDIGNENFRQIERQLKLFEKKTDQLIQEKYAVHLKHYDDIEVSLIPNDAPQERIWNVVYYLNRYGLTFCKELCDLNLTFNEKHKLVIL